MAESLTSDNVPAKTAKEDEKLLLEIRERFDRAQNFWREIRKEGATDMRYVAGDPWEPKDRRAREDAGRPCLSFDEMGQYFNQVINDVRANPRAVKFSPRGNGANDETARFYQDKMREIEYRSNAQNAYTTAFQNTVERSYGWCGLTTKFQPKSFDQEIWIRDIPNPDLILCDPEAVKPASSDMKYLFEFETWDTKEFRRKFPKAAISDFSEFAETLKSWVKEGGEKIVLAVYWRVVMTKKRLLRLQSPDGQSFADFYEDELAQMPPGGIKISEREEEVPTVENYLTNGVEILKREKWAGKYIPFASCYGKRIYVDTGAGPTLQIMSMTRLARGPQMSYCYYATSEAEVVGRVPKIPAIGYEGQFREHETEWQESIHIPKAFLTVKPTTAATGDQILPLPTMQTWEPPIQALAIGKEGARRAIQAAMGTMVLPTQAQKRNEKSGVALQVMEQTAQKGSYHFVDAYDMMIEHIGVMSEDLMDKIYDSTRETGIVEEDKTSKLVRINDPAAEKLISTKGDHGVTVSTGPAFESQREAASDFADSLANNPAIFGIIGDLVVKLKNLGPIGDKIADRLKAMLPPQIQAMEASPDDPNALRGQLMAAMGELDKVKQFAQEQYEANQTDAVKMNAQFQQKQLQEASDTDRERIKATMQAAKIAADERIAALDNLIKLAIAEINAEAKEASVHAEMARDELGFRHEHQLRAEDRTGESLENERDRQSNRSESREQRHFDRDSSLMDQAFQADESERNREAARQQADEEDGA